MSKKLRRGTHDRVLFGVCRGIANYFGLDVALIRILWVISMFFGGAGILVYFVLIFVMPKDDYIEYK